MSKLSQLLNERNRDGWSALEVGRRAEANGYDLKPATVTALFGGRHAKQPKPQTLEAVASVLPVRVAEMREALGLPPDPGEPWNPPDEARQLTTDQRAALGQLIKTIVNGGQQDGLAPEAEKTPGEGVAGAAPDMLDVRDEAIRLAVQDDSTLAARRTRESGKMKATREADAHVGEESQDDGGFEPA